MQDTQSDDRGAAAVDLAEAFCCQSRLRVEALFDALWANADDVDTGAARDVLAGRYAWLEAGVLDQSEGTGPWIADWQSGASTEENLHHPVIPSTRAPAG
jgi:hypothetical protein